MGDLGLFQWLSYGGNKMVSKYLVRYDLRVCEIRYDYFFLDLDIVIDEFGGDCI